MMKKQKKSPIAALLLAVLLLLPAGCGVQSGAADTPPGGAQQTEGKDQYQTDPVPDGKPGAGGAGRRGGGYRYPADVYHLHLLRHDPG